jgi:hypothetical protein
MPVLIEAGSASKGIRAVVIACAAGFLPALAPAHSVADSYVAFDMAPTAECRDITPRQRIAQYPNQRLIEVALPVSVRFHGLTTDEVDELAIEIVGISPGMRVNDFAPTTQLASDIAEAIETTTTSKKNRSFDASLGGTIPVPGAEAVAHITPSLNAGLAKSDTETEKISRLPPKRAVVVSGTSSAGRGVFFKLKRYSQASLEGVHDLKVTFVVPRAWKWSQIRVDCTAQGEQKVLWMKQSGTVGHATRTVQLVESAARPVRQTVLKPSETNHPLATEEPAAAKPKATTAGRWKPTVHETAAIEVAVEPDDDRPSKNARAAAILQAKVGVVSTSDAAD